MEKHDFYTEHSNGYGIYVLVWMTLLALTGLTVAVAGMNLGGLTIATVIIIASIEGYLILTIFMHLRSDSRVFLLFVSVAGLFLLISFILLFSNCSFQ
ncbi:hypothetical protein BMS3Abin03_01725 [bacterium BMS3Abin03]|nr:hypothetical protein BMS3Abin03_01725 [bacterium BMS3Abin03]